MTHQFAELLFNPAVQAEQTRLGTRAQNERLHARGGPNQVLSAQETTFIAARDSFYLATANLEGWPYIQHRGGPIGFVKVLDASRIAFADFAGNRQYISIGHLTENDRVALFFMDYPSQMRLKLLGHARTVDAAADPALIEQLKHPTYRARVERAIVIEVAAFDWNCSQHITPRYSEAELATTRG
jgi:uncharacterized protein